LSNPCPCCKSEQKFLWFAKGGGAVRLGPFNSQLEAFEAIRNPKGNHYDDAFVWAEKAEDAEIRSKPWRERFK